MARYHEAVCRLCRREKEKLFLKGERCYTDKCTYERRKDQIPGMHWQRRSKTSDYGVQLREKQKAKRIYGILERQFRTYFAKAEKMRGVTGEKLLAMLEQRLDNVVYRLSFANSRNEARLLIRHGHFQVNGRKVSIPSFQVKPGATVTVKEKSRKLARIKEALEALPRRQIPAWLEVNPDKCEGTVKSVPTREEIGGTINEKLIIELYSK